jgi:hypothetical protein
MMIHAEVLPVDIEPGVGLTVRDRLRGGNHFLADIGLSHTVEIENLLATRLFSLEDHGFVMTGGAGLPVTAPVAPKIKNALDRRFGSKIDYARLTPTEESDLAALVIRTCLDLGMGSRIAYGTHAEESSSEARQFDRRAARLGNPNDSCPCGSGRKLRSCCGRRPRR